MKCSEKFLTTQYSYNIGLYPMRKKAKKLSVAIVTIALLSSVFAPGAMAQSGDSDCTYATGKTVEDKRAYAEQLEEQNCEGSSSSSGQVGTQAVYDTKEGTDQASSTHNGADMKGQTRFAEQTDYSESENKMTVNGTSEATWYGSDPYTADTIKIEQVITIGVEGTSSVSLSIPPSWTVSNGNKKASLTTSWQDKWDVSKQYSGIVFETGGKFKDADQNDYFTFKFSGTAYTPSTHVDLNPDSQGKDWV
ncbi:hypothetical protein M0R89_12705 [Halorussus limi]|uniref:Uncharacterized protein n=1 Tax=Halorussus limi TaxID=2938695 RepID=A0A8U0HR22_9EURY|nr:hypothetical protein [Halorussus limi]UPV73400.1 hypothetical protein M0R89_12705 [Halorussus limi]